MCARGIVGTIFKMVEKENKGKRKIKNPNITVKTLTGI